LRATISATTATASAKNSNINPPSDQLCIELPRHLFLFRTRFSRSAAST